MKTPAPATPATPEPKSEVGDPKSEAGKVKPNPQPAANVGLSAVDLIQQLESNPAAFDTGLMAGDDDGEAARAAAAATAETPAAPPEAGSQRPEAEVKAGAGGVAATLNADQTAWLELRAAAKTPEEAAQVDAQAPAFTDAEWAIAEKVFSPETARGDARPTEAKAGDEGVAATLTAAQAEAAKFKTEAEATSKRLQETEAELAAARAKPLAVAPMNPLFLKDATQLDQAEAEAAAVKDWALKHWDGCAAVTAENGQAAQPAYSAEQVRGAFATADRQLTQIIPAARETLAEHMAANVQAKAVYPEMFDAASPHHQTTQSILRRLPGLRAALPNVNTVIGDAILGETLRTAILSETPTAEAKALAAALVKALPALAKFMPALTRPATAGKPAFKLPAKPVVPLARPGSGGGRLAAPLRPPGTNGKSATGPSVKQFVTLRTENGGNDLAALTETLRNVNVE